MPNIETERLRMIDFKLELVNTIVTDKTKLKPHFGIKAHEDWPMKDYAEILPLKLEELRENPSKAVWSGLIIEKETEIIVGDMGCKGGPDAEGTVDIGYSIVPEKQGQGFATEMATGLIRWLFLEQKVTQVKADCLKTNRPSIRVLEKIGMKQVAEDDEFYYWSIKRNRF
ncbi:GNAT family N-acetyltransferase [Bacillus sp. Marseille-Q3570]|uniref:GNAT family N-acetyltransferase n=1 Tax=Bacillus sp. Marseille-Q3570 TaxID=2963522 RepID=UPI0021B82332|nr:GNAT family N-acetyltransferase [Bacillus sp. Marseille-Q3570]